MATTRLKKSTTSAIRNTAEFTATVKEVASLQLRIEQEQAALNAAIAAAQEEAKEKIAALKTERDAKFATVSTYAEENRDALFPGVRKTAESALATYGFRLSPPALKQLSKAWTAERSIEALSMDGMEQYLTVKTALNKDALKDDLAEPELAKYGLRLVQSDEFWIEPARAAGEPADARLTA